MEDLRPDGFYHIKVTNVKDKTTWDHRRVPYDHVENLKLSPNLEVKVIKFVGTEEFSRGPRSPRGNRGARS